MTEQISETREGIPERFSKMAQTLGFKYLSDVRGARNANHLFIEANRDSRPHRKNPNSGIYMLIMSDGSIYIGQSKDVKQRFLQHLEDRNKVIDYLAYKRCTLNDLDDKERQCILDAQDHGYPIVNHDLIRVTPISDTTPYDVILPPKQQEAFITGIASRQSFLGVWANKCKAASPMANEDWRRFRLLPRAMDLIAAARLFVNTTIPCPEETVQHFWRVTVDNNPRKNAECQALQITCGMYAALTISYFKQVPQQYFVTMALATEFFEEACSNSPSKNLFPWARILFPERQTSTGVDMPALSDELGKSDADSPKARAADLIREITMTDTQALTKITVPLDAFEDTLSNGIISTSAAIANIACMREENPLAQGEHNELAAFRLLNF